MLVNNKYISVKFSESKLKKRHRSLAVLYDIANDLTSSLSLLEILDRAILKVKEHFKVDVVRIYLMDHEKQCLRLAAHKGLTKKQLEGLHTVSLDKGFTGKAARTKSFIAQKVTELRNGHRTFMLQHVGLKIIICVPLIVKGKVVGVMNLGLKGMFSLNQEKIDLLVAIGNQIAVAANVAGLYEDVWQKAQEIEKKKNELEFFTYAISHDLKNPAIGVSGFAKLLFDRYEKTLDEKGKQYCRHIMGAARQIENFTQDINAYIASKKLTYHFKKTDLSKILGQIQNELAHALTERHITFRRPEYIPKIVADESAMTRVFKNLIDNALKHGGERLSEITVGYDERNGNNIFSVQNDGTTLEEDGTEVIFEMFRKHPSSAHSEGSGLGLAIVKEMIEAHQGETWCESTPDQGTTFYVSLPKKIKKQ